MNLQYNPFTDNFDITGLTVAQLNSIFLRIDATNGPLKGRLTVNDGSIDAQASLEFPANVNVNLGAVNSGDLWRDSVQFALFLWLTKVHSLETCINTNILAVDLPGVGGVEQSMIDGNGIGIIFV